MKISKILNIVLVVCSLMSCQAKKDNIELTDFAKELLSLYINDQDNFSAKNRKNEIVIESFIDTQYYGISVFFHTSKLYKFCEENFVGKTSYLGHFVRVFGDEISIFYFVRDKIKARKCRKNDLLVLYNPNVWQIWIHKKDTSFCKMMTYKFINNEDISAIEDLAGKYFKICQCADPTGADLQSVPIKQSKEKNE